MKNKEKAKKNIVEKALEKDNQEDLNVLKINENYAKRFEHNKKREHLEKATKKFGEKALFNKINDNEEDSEDDESEDSEAELINPKVMEKFISTMVMLQDEKASKEFLEKKESLFNEDDFQTQKEKQNKENKEGKVTVKEMMLKTEGDDEDNIYSLNYKPKVKVDSEMRALKNELLEAAKRDNELEKMGDDDFLVKKVKTEEENVELNDVGDQKDVEEMNLDELLTVNKC
jgi:protein KRI1